jgi:hypothetical protein
MSHKTLNWLASYPKSGNTWVRTFLAACQLADPRQFKLHDTTSGSVSACRLQRFETAAGRSRRELTPHDIDRLRHKVQHELAATVGPEHVIKTHNLRADRNGFPLIYSEFVRKVVYIVRNPLDIVDSWADHSNLSIDQAIELMNTPTHTLNGNQWDLVPQYLHTWSAHVASWTQRTDLPLLIMRYEDILRNPEAQFERLIDFLEWPIPIPRIHQAAEVTSIHQLRQLEERDGFSETNRNAKSGRFFRVGDFGRWSQILTKEQAQRVISDHRQMMTVMRYRIPDLDVTYSDAADRGIPSAE